MMQTSDAMREKQLNIRVSGEELARLRSVSEHYGVNVPNLIRMLVKREADALAREPGGLNTPTAPTKKARRRKR